MFSPSTISKLGPWAIVCLTLFPLLLLNTPLPFSWLGLGRIFGLTGSVLLSLNFLLALRSRKLEPYFGGMNRLYIIHHLTGAWAFIFLLFHPVALFLAGYSITPSLSRPAELFGTLALTVLMILLILTFFIPLPYHIWKLTHSWIGAALLLASIHTYLIPSDMSTNLPLRIYILGFAALGLAAYVYRTLLGRWLVKKTPYTVHAVEILNNEVTMVTLEPVKKPISFTAGQFIFIDVKSLGISRESHPFSLAGDPDSPQLRIAAKSSGDYTETLKLLKPGSRVFVEGPFGGFLYQQARFKSQIWIAGGIGITPFLSMSADLAHRPDYEAVLYYVVSTPDEAIFSPKNVNLHTHISKTQGRLTAQQVVKENPDFKKTDIFICGPPPMMKSLRDQFNKLGVKNSRVHTEEFSLQ